LLSGGVIGVLLVGSEVAIAFPFPDPKSSGEVEVGVVNEAIHYSQMYFCYWTEILKLISDKF
jgi:hypothetical protein